MADVMQGVLPIEGASTCGYCLRTLVLQPGLHWQCPRCGPLLAMLGARAVATTRSYAAVVADFAAFQREAWRDRQR